MQVPKRRKNLYRSFSRVVPLEAPTGLGQPWSLDFIHDSLFYGRRFRALTIVDDFRRESLAIEVDACISGHRMTRALDQLGELRGLPQVLVMDNGPEFTSMAMLAWIDATTPKPCFTLLALEIDGKQ